MTEKEQKFVDKYLEYYTKYNGDIPSHVWIDTLSNYRKSLGIGLKRSSELTIEAVKNLNSDMVDNKAEEIENHQSSFHNIFYYNAADWFGYDNGYDCRVGKNITDAGLATLRANYEIGLDEEIVFERDTSFWINHNQGIVITDKAIYCIPDNDNMDDVIIFNWSEFDEVKYKELSFYFKRENQDVGHLGFDYFFKDVDSEKKKEVGIKLADLLTKLSKLFENEVDPIDLASQGKYDDALSLVDTIIQNNPKEADGYFFKARIIYMLESSKEESEKVDESKLEEALDLLDTAEDLVGDIPQNLSLIHWNKGHVNSMLGRTYYARNEYIMALDECDSEDRKELQYEISDSENNMKDLWDNYINEYDYKERKYIMPIKDYDIAGCVVNGIDVFRMSNIPSCFRFPTGHPIANQLYIGHPYNPSLYVPYEDSEDIFFVDKVHELCYLLECLGAEEISITSIKGKNVSEFNQSDSQVSANVNIKLSSVDGSKAQSSENKKDMSSQSHRSMSIKLDPMKKPYVPDGLIWYPEQPQWQRLVKSRINSNMLEYNEYVSSSQTKFTNDSEKSDIKVAAKHLWMKANAEVEQSINRQFKESEESQWKVEVKFRSIKKLEEAQKTSIPSNEQEIESVSNLSQDEQSYIEEIQFCLENDGIISDKERRYLNRMREKLNISEARALELEEICSQPRLTDDEKEYLEALKDEITDGSIPERARRLLDRLRISMDISEERAKEIEKIALR